MAAFEKMVSPAIHVEKQDIIINVDDEKSSKIPPDNEDGQVVLTLTHGESETVKSGKGLEFGGAAVSVVLDLGHDDTPPPEYSVTDPLNTKTASAAGSSASSSLGSSSDLWDEDDYADDTASETGPSWSELALCGKVKRVLIGWVGKCLALIGLLYLFICSLDFLSSAFRLIGGKAAGNVFSDSELLQNPVTGLMIGILATVMVQSSSTSTSIVVTMVASGIIDVKPAIPIIMGANIGTSVTNTFVSMAQCSDRNEFRRAFAGATVHDMFNWLTVIVLLPLEVATGYLHRLTSEIVKICDLQTNKGTNKDMLKVITKPLTKLVVQVDKKVIEGIAAGKSEYQDKNLLKKFCTFEAVTTLRNVTSERNISTTVNGAQGFAVVNVTDELNVTEHIGVERCNSLFSQWDIDDTFAGGILLLCSVAILCTCLILMVKILHSVLKGQIAKIIKKTLNSDFPGCFSFLTGYVAMVVGAVMTMLVQSSSVFTSALTPLVGIGLIRLERMYPMTLGSNIGTTTTGVLAALAAPGDKLAVALQIALCHLLFNVSGIILFYPVPILRRIPIRLAKCLGTTTSKYRWFPIVYLISLFVLLPGSVFAMSFAGTIPSMCVGSVLALLLVFVVTVNVLQRKRPKLLPEKMRTWEFLPLCLRSLEPMDKVMSKIQKVLKKLCPCCCHTKQTKQRTYGEGSIERTGEQRTLFTNDISPVCSTLGLLDNQVTRL